MKKQKSKVAVICALKCEASPVAAALGLTIIDEPFRHYGGKDALVIVSGPGGQNSIQAIRAAAHSFPDIGTFINLGIAGCRDTNISKGSLFLINQIIAPDERLPHYPDMLLNSQIPEAGLITFDKPMTSFNIPLLLADMEGYYFYNECLSYVRSSHIHLLKSVSDHMDPSAVSKNMVSALIHSRIDDIKEYIQNASSMVTQPVPSGISKYCSRYRFSAAMEAQLEKLNRYYLLRNSTEPGESIYGGFSIPDEKKESMRIFSEIKRRLVQK